MNRIVSGALLAMLLASILYPVFNIRPAESVEATDTIYIRADGSIEPSSANMTTSNNETYILTGNVRWCAIVVERDNIVVDGAGYAIEGGGSGEGITLEGRSNVTIENLTIKRFYNGIWLNYSSNSILSGNNAANNSYGIYLDSSSGNTLSSNNVASSGYGIWLGSSSNNSVFHNSFVNNAMQVYAADSDNTWDDGYPSGGNYWSDYSDVDLCNGPNQDKIGSDGIGDTPYIIDSENQDSYPLMKPYPWASHDIGITAITASKTVVGQGYNVSINAMLFNYGNETETFNVTVYANSTTQTIDYISWYRGHTSTHRIGFETSVDGKTWTAHPYNPILSTQHYFPLVVRDTGTNKFYLFVSTTDGNMYLYNVTNYTSPVAMNSGNPVYTHNATTSQWDYQIFNPGIAVVNGVWHMVLESKASGGNFKIGYAYSNLTELNWNKHKSAAVVIFTSKDAGNPFLIYVPERNALLAIHGVTSSASSTWRIVASYASLSDDLSLAASWHSVSNTTLMINEAGVHITDPSMMANFNSTYPIMISYVRAQANIYQEYCALSLKQFYDGCVYGNNTITLVSEPANPTRMPDDSWEGIEVTEVSDFHIGTLNETARSTVIASQTMNLTSGNSATITWAWNATDYAKGNYTICVVVSPLQDEAYTQDNMIADYWVFISIMGDVDGDRKVDLRDVFAVGEAYGSVISDRRYNPNLDINGDSKIDLKDYYTTCYNYGKSW